MTAQSSEPDPSTNGPTLVVHNADLDAAIAAYRPKKRAPRAHIWVILLTLLVGLASSAIAAVGGTTVIVVAARSHASATTAAPKVRKFKAPKPIERMAVDALPDWFHQAFAVETTRPSIHVAWAPKPVEPVQYRPTPSVLPCAFPPLAR